MLYGSQRLEKDVKFWTKLGNNSTSLLKILILLFLKTVTPLALLSINIARYAGLSLDGWWNNGCQDFPWVYVLGWSLFAAVVGVVFMGGCFVVHQQVDFGLLEVN